MFVKKSRHFIEFSFILIAVCFLSYFLMKALLGINIKLPHNDLEFNPDNDSTIDLLLDDNDDN